MNDKQTTKPQEPKTQTNVPTEEPSITESEQASQLERALALLKPVVDFHQSVEDAGENDMRLFWDVRMVRGRDIPFCHVHGSTSLPAMLAYNMRSMAPSVIQDEVNEKILRPLLSNMQRELEKTSYQEKANQEMNGDFTTESECYSEDTGDEPENDES